MNTNSYTNGEFRHLKQWAYKVRNAACRQSLVFDVGANEGDFTANVLRLLDNAEVHCFEPHPATFARLQARFKHNKRVIVNQCGIGSANEDLYLYDHKGSRGSPHSSFRKNTFTDLYTSESERVLVPVTTLDKYIVKHRISGIAYLKIDVEGFEEEVFKGMMEGISARRFRVIQFEFNAHNILLGLSLYRIRQLLTGYDIYKLLANGTEAIGGNREPYNTRAEIFKYSNYVAVPSNNEAVNS